MVEPVQKYAIYNCKMRICVNQNSEIDKFDSVGIPCIQIDALSHRECWNSPLPFYKFHLGCCNHIGSLHPNQQCSFTDRGFYSRVGKYNRIFVTVMACYRWRQCQDSTYWEKDFLIPLHATWPAHQLNVWN